MSEQQGAATSPWRLEFPDVALFRCAHVATYGRVAISGLLLAPVNEAARCRKGFFDTCAIYPLT